MQNNTRPLVISSSPHMHNSNTISKAMIDVILALLPASLVGIYLFRFPAVLVIISCVVAAMLTEALCQKLMNRPITVCDGSAALTGLLLALCLPPTISPIIAAFGSFCAITIGKQVFGGLGQNIFNPAHLARAILLTSLPVAMSTWVNPVTMSNSTIDAVSTATPLALLRNAESTTTTALANELSTLPNLYDLFMGNVSGSLGETSVIALLIGGAYLIYRGHVDWRVPVGYLGTVVAITFLWSMYKGYGMWYPLYHLFAGGLVIGAFFMATDWVTNPITKKGRLIYAICLGIITCLIRIKGSFPEGVCYSILIMNMFTPLIDRYVRNKPLGGEKIV